MAYREPISPITVPAIRKRKGSSKRITALTAYDYTFARLIDQAGVDIILVGDSLASVVQGHKTTLPVNLEELIYHCSLVSRAVEHSLVVGDLPFLSYQVSVERAVESAGMMLKRGGAAAVKLEGGIFVAEHIERITRYDIPVMGHIGLTPQSYHRMGGHKRQGLTEGGALGGAGGEAGTRGRLLEDARAVEQAGAFAVVLEGIPGDLAREITSMLSIPTIGIGAGLDCDGQILVSYDMLGLCPEQRPEFVKQYRRLAEEVIGAVKEYCGEVRGVNHAPQRRDERNPGA